MKILLTGSEGNIGKRLYPYLKEQGHELFRIDIKQGYGKDYAVGNICSVFELGKVFSDFKPEVVFHMAAMVSRITCEASPALTAETNLAGVQNVIQLCLEHNAKMIYFSTSEVYGNLGGELKEDILCHPNNYYGLTKLMGEMLVHYSCDNVGLKAVIVRPFMFYDELEDMGEHRSAMIRFAEGLLRKEKITLHEGAMRSWLHMEDAVRALEKTMYLDWTENNCETLNIGHPDVIPMDKLASLMCGILQLNKEELINITPLPERMTLTKYPNLEKQNFLLKIVPRVSLEEGVIRVLNVTKEKIAADQSLARRGIPYTSGRVSASGSFPEWLY